MNWGHSPAGEAINGQVAFRIWVSANSSCCRHPVHGHRIGLGVYAASARNTSSADRFVQGLWVLSFNTPVPVACLAVVLLAIALNRPLGSTLLSSPGAESRWSPGSGRGPRLRLHHAGPAHDLAHVRSPSADTTCCSARCSWRRQRRLRSYGALQGADAYAAIRRHGLRTSLIPVATSVAFTIPALFTGAVIAETVFGWDGMGRYFTETISTNDVHGVVAVAAFGALMTAIGAILADLVMVALDPG